jgi:hypothetical protein
MAAVDPVQSPPAPPQPAQGAPVDVLANELVQRVDAIARNARQTQETEILGRDLRNKTLIFLGAGILSFFVYVITIQPPVFLLVAGTLSIVAGILFASKLERLYRTPTPSSNENILFVLSHTKGNPSTLNPDVLNIFREQARHVKTLDIEWTKGFNAFSQEEVTALINSLRGFFPELQELKLESCSHLKNISLQGLSDLRNLTSLDLSKTDIDDDYLALLRHIPSLRKLKLRSCDSITSNGIDRLGNQNIIPPLALQELDISGNCLGNVRNFLSLKAADLGFLRHFPRLTYLSISHIDNDALNFIITTCPLLEHLSIPYSTVLTGNNFDRLSQFQRLTTLSLGRCREITPQAFVKLGEIYNIRTLFFLYPVDSYVIIEQYRKNILRALADSFEPFPRRTIFDKDPLTSRNMIGPWVRRIQ